MRANTLQDYNDGLEKAVSRAITDAFQTWQEETKV